MSVSVAYKSVGDDIETDQDHDESGDDGNAIAMGLRPSPAGGAFCHAACCVRILFLIGGFVLLIIVGTLIAGHNQHAGGVLLAVGPTGIIITLFYRRYLLSTSLSQVCITFIAAILWMLPLLHLIARFDPVIARYTGKQSAVTCSWLGNRGVGKATVYTLSYVANCSALPPGCRPQKAMLLDLLISKEGYMNLQTVATMEEQIADSSDDVVCEDLEIMSEDALSNKVHVQSITHGHLRLTPRSKAHLAEAFPALFGRKGVEGCHCKLSYWEGAMTPSDYCGVRDHSTQQFCYVQDPSCLGDSGQRITQCAPEAHEKVEITYGFYGKTVAWAFITAYFRAALLEELLKYVAVRGVLFKDRVVDPGCLVVYGLAAGAGFATAENVQYMLMFGHVVTYMRMVTSIPLHCCTGLIIGIHLGYRKFLGRRCYCVPALAIPILVHGSYDFPLMLPAGDDLLQEWRLMIPLSVLIFACIYCRWAWLELEGVAVVNVHAMEQSGEIQPPFICSLLRCKKLRGGLCIALWAALCPRDPGCQTAPPSSCPDCCSKVRAHLFFPSFCPHCGAALPTPESRPHEEDDSPSEWE